MSVDGGSSGKRAGSVALTAGVRSWTQSCFITGVKRQQKEHEAQLSPRDRATRRDS